MKQLLWLLFVGFLGGSRLSVTSAQSKKLAKEIQYNTSCNDNRSGRTCFTTFFNRQLKPVRKSFEDASEWCKKNVPGSSLIVIKSEKDQQNVVRFIHEQGLGNETIIMDAQKLPIDQSHNVYWVDGRLERKKELETRLALDFLQNPPVYVPYNVTSLLRYICENSDSTPPFSYRHNDKYYAASERNATWYDARNECLRSGGDLATITDRQSIRNWLNKSQNQSYWIGHHLNRPKWNWKSTGAALTYSNWNNGFPDESVGKECICFSPKCRKEGRKIKISVCEDEYDRKWKTCYCNNNYTIVCQKDVALTTRTVLTKKKLSPTSTDFMSTSLPVSATAKSHRSSSPLSSITRRASAKSTNSATSLSNPANHTSTLAIVTTTLGKTPTSTTSITTTHSTKYSPATNATLNTTAAVTKLTTNMSTSFNKPSTATTSNATATTFTANTIITFTQSPISNALNSTTTPAKTPIATNLTTTTTSIKAFVATSPATNTTLTKSTAPTSPTTKKKSNKTHNTTTSTASTISTQIIISSTLTKSATSKRTPVATKRTKSTTSTKTSIATTTSALGATSTKTFITISAPSTPSTKTTIDTTVATNASSTKTLTVITPTANTTSAKSLSAIAPFATTPSTEISISTTPTTSATTIKASTATTTTTVTITNATTSQLYPRISNLPADTPPVADSTAGEIGLDRKTTSTSSVTQKPSNHFAENQATDQESSSSAGLFQSFGTKEILIVLLSIVVVAFMVVVVILAIRKRKIKRQNEVFHMKSTTQRESASALGTTVIPKNRPSNGTIPPGNNSYYSDVEMTQRPTPSSKPIYASVQPTGEPIDMGEDVAYADLDLPKKHQEKSRCAKKITASLSPFYSKLYEPSTSASNSQYAEPFNSDKTPAVAATAPIPKPPCVW